MIEEIEERYPYERTISQITQKIPSISIRQAVRYTTVVYISRRPVLDRQAFFSRNLGADYVLDCHLILSLIHISEPTRPY